jgi:hypothetical protein
VVLAIPVLGVFSFLFFFCGVGGGRWWDCGVWSRRWRRAIWMERYIYTLGQTEISIPPQSKARATAPKKPEAQEQDAAKITGTVTDMYL